MEENMIVEENKHYHSNIIPSMLTFIDYYRHGISNESRESRRRGRDYQSDGIPYHNYSETLKVVSDDFNYLKIR